MKRKTVVIRYSMEYGEYRVPGNPKDPADKSDRYMYFTDARKDAEDTARVIHGTDATIKIRRVY